jgi:hypothetical protein
MWQHLAVPFFVGALLNGRPGTRQLPYMATIWQRHAEACLVWHRLPNMATPPLIWDQHRPCMAPPRCALF